MCPAKSVKNIALIGFSTTGKSAVAKKVAEYLRWESIDSDDEIVKLSGRTIPEIFARDGEDKFRQLERQVLKKACLREKVVISTGGGAILHPENVKILQRTCIIVCLEAKVQTIYQRLRLDALYSSNPVVRPLLAGKDPVTRIKQLKAFRQPYYAIADWTVHTDNLTVEEVSREVIRGWQYVNSSIVNVEQDKEPDIACMVNTASRSYPVFVGWGLLSELGAKMRQVGLSGKAVIISDKIVGSFYCNQTERHWKKLASKLVLSWCHLEKLLRVSIELLKSIIFLSGDV